MLVTITADHHDRGVPGRCTLCPVALALEEATGKVWGISYGLPSGGCLAWQVNPSCDLAMSRLCPSLAMPLPPAVADYILALDAGRDVRDRLPLTFNFPWEKEG